MGMGGAGGLGPAAAGPAVVVAADGHSGGAGGSGSGAGGSGSGGGGSGVGGGGAGVGDCAPPPIGIGAGGGSGVGGGGAGVGDCAPPPIGIGAGGGSGGAGGGSTGDVGGLTAACGKGCDQSIGGGISPLGLAGGGYE